MGNVKMHSGLDFMPGHLAGNFQADVGTGYDFMPAWMVEKERKAREAAIKKLEEDQERSRKEREKIKAEVEKIKEDPRLRKEAEDLLAEAAEREGLTTEELQELGELPNPDTLPDAEEVEAKEAKEGEETYVCECGFEAKSKAGLEAHKRSKAHKEAMAEKEG